MMAFLATLGVLLPVRLAIDGGSGGVTPPAVNVMKVGWLPGAPPAPGVHPHAGVPDDSRGAQTRLVVGPQRDPCFAGMAGGGGPTQ